MTLRWPAIALAVVAACGDNRAAPQVGFDWRLDLAGLDPALLAVWTGGGEVIAAGGDPAAWLIEWDRAAGTWRAPALPDGTGTLWWIWAEQPGATAWAVGGRAAVLRRDAGAWTAAGPGALVDPITTFYGVWGAGDDLWVVGGTLTPSATPGVILRRTSAGWTVEHLATAPLYKVWGTAADDVWAVGEGGAILHRDGSGTWTPASSGTTARLIAVAGRARDEAYAVGGVDAGVVLRWDGARWSVYADVAVPLSAVWTAPGRALYVGGAAGHVERFGAADDADPDPAARSVQVLAADFDIHTLAGGPERVIAVGADLRGAISAGFHGALATHGDPLGGVAFPDAAPADAPADAPIDAVDFDAPVDGPDDAPVDGPPDAPVDARPDANGPAYGAPCALPPAMVCATGFTCLTVEQDNANICTEFCTDVGACGGYGPGACCAIAHPQLLETVCLPAMYCP